MNPDIVSMGAGAIFFGNGEEVALVTLTFSDVHAIACLTYIATT